MDDLLAWPPLTAGLWVGLWAFAVAVDCVWAVAVALAVALAVAVALALAVALAVTELCRKSQLGIDCMDTMQNRISESQNLNQCPCALGRSSLEH